MTAFAQISDIYDEKEVLLPYQRRWMADDSQLKIAEKKPADGAYLGRSC